MMHRYSLHAQVLRFVSILSSSHTSWPTNTLSQPPLQNHFSPMPLYEFLCLAKSALPRQHLVRMMSRVGELVMGDGGIVTNVVSYGDQSLAYDIRKPFQRHDKVRELLSSIDQLYAIVNNIPSCRRLTYGRSTSSQNQRPWRRLIGS